MKRIEEHIKSIRGKLDKWNHEYYVLDKPSVDDFVYDELMKELLELETANPSLITFDSPSQKVGGTVIEKFEKFIHLKPMMSLGNAFNKEDLVHFDNQIKKELGNNKYSYSCELKIDGVSISLHYKDGKLFKGVTRGDGITGEEVTNNIKTIKSLPLSIEYKDDLEVRGEIFFKKSDFSKINEKRLKLNKDLFANPRNAAAGTIRQLDSKVVSNRNLDAFIYFWLNNDIESQDDAFNKLSSNKFKINKENKICNSIDEVFEYCKKYEETRSKLDYEIDGIVIKVNETKYYDELGKTAKFPKWAIAFKFKAEVSQTKLIDIVPTVGRTGRITYNARLEPVTLAGTIVQNATLHNANYIKDLDIRINDIVNVKKAGDIIPKVLSPVKEKRTKDCKEWKAHEVCPICKTHLEIFEGEVDQYCVNVSCKARIQQSIIHFVSKKAMNIDGLGERIIETLIDEKIISNVADIYKLEDHKDKIINMEGFGQKSYDNFVKAISDSKTLPLNNVLFGLGIRHIGEKVAKSIATKYKSIDNIIKISKEEALDQYEIGPKITDSIIHYFSSEKNVNLINDLKANGVLFNEVKQIKIIESKYKNKKMVLTGTLSIPRDEMKKKLESLGVDVIGTISKNIDYLLAGENAGSKLDKAKTLKVEVISEDDINKLF